MSDREKLVELLTDNLPRCGNLPSRDNPLQLSCDEQVQRIADHLIMNGVTVQKWISASEPPKKITNKVIVLCKNGYRGFGHYEDYKGERIWYNIESGKPFTDWDLVDCENYEVTHWMPLPEPPKGE